MFQFCPEFKYVPSYILYTLLNKSNGAKHNFIMPEQVATKEVLCHHKHMGAGRLMWGAAPNIPVFSFALVWIQTRVTFNYFVYPLFVNSGNTKENMMKNEVILLHKLDINIAIVFYNRLLFSFSNT